MAGSRRWEGQADIQKASLTANVGQINLTSLGGLNELFACPGLNARPAFCLVKGRGVMAKKPVMLSVAASGRLPLRVEQRVQLVPRRRL